MRRMSYSKITDILRRIHDAVDTAQKKGCSPKEILKIEQEQLKIASKAYAQHKERRKFLKSTASVAGASALICSPVSILAATSENNGVKNGQSQPSIAIIGAGAGGVRTAHRLKQYGIESTVFEGADRIGGRMYSERDYFSDDRVVEWGGELISTEHTAIRNLAHQLGLKLEDVGKGTSGEEEVYLIDGVLYNEYDLLDEWVGGLYELFKRTQQVAPWQPFYNAHTQAHFELDNITAQDWLSQNGYPSSHWVHKLLMTDLIAEYGRVDDNSALNLIYLLGWTTRNSGGIPLAGTDERFKISRESGGNGAVVERMVDEVGTKSFKMGKKVIAINGDYLGPYQLIFEDGSNETFQKIVISIPYHLIKHIDFDPRIWNGFSPAKQQSIFEMKPADNGKLQLEFESRSFARVQSINNRSVHTSAVSYSGPEGFISTWEGDVFSSSPKGIIVNYTGGYYGRNLGGDSFHGEAAQADIDRLLSDYERIWPGISTEFTGKALVSNWWKNPWSQGAFISPVVGTMTSFWGAQFESEGSIYFAGEACDVETWSYMNGAISSGERIAKEIFQSF